LLRRLSTAGAALVVLAGLAMAFGSAASAQQGPPDGGFVDVVKVDGLLDPVMVDFVERTVANAEREGPRWLILQADSTGAVVPSRVLDELVETIDASTVPVAVWVGPSGSVLTGGSARLALAADELGMAPGTRFGDWAGPTDAEPEAAGRLAPAALRTLNDSEADELGVTTRPAPTIGDFIVGLPGVESREVVADDGETRLEPVTQVRFGQLELFEQLMHTVASPAVAYLLFAVGLGLIVFELFTAGVGVAGVIGAGCFVLSCYGLAALPTRWWGVALLVVAFVAFAVDVQTGVPRFWTGAGVVAFVLGSLTLYDGLALSWVTLGVAIVAVLLTFLGGMPSMVRTRFSTPTIGREWMMGELGRAVTDIAPDGVVQIRDAMWRAFTNRATPIEQLDQVRVVGIEGLVLEVEPEEGGARDYRERRPRKGSTDEVDPPEPG
jgi:membrane-bound serine protease (ClpP class)